MKIDTDTLIYELMKILKADIQKHVYDQRSIDETPYPPLKYRVGRRNILTGTFVKTGIIADKETRTVGPSPEYEVILEGLQRYCTIMGISNSAYDKMEKFAEERISKDVDDFIDKIKIKGYK